MTTTIDIQKLFTTWEPWDCSNSEANLGPRAAELTWNCAMDLAANVKDWLVSDPTDALNYICRWARETGAWTQDEIQAWSEQECFALLVQNIASGMRELGCDDLNWAEVLEAYNETDWVEASWSPAGHLYAKNGEVFYDIHE